MLNLILGIAMYLTQHNFGKICYVQVKNFEFEDYSCLADFLTQQHWDVIDYWKNEILKQTKIINTTHNGEKIIFHNKLTCSKLNQNYVTLNHIPAEITKRGAEEVRKFTRFVQNLCYERDNNLTEADILTIKAKFALDETQLSLSLIPNSGIIDFSKKLENNIVCYLSSYLFHLLKSLKEKINNPNQKELFYHIYQCSLQNIPYEEYFNKFEHSYEMEKIKNTINYLNSFYKNILYFSDINQYLNDLISSYKYRSSIGLHECCECQAYDEFEFDWDDVTWENLNKLETYPNMQLIPLTQTTKSSPFEE